MKIYIFLTKTSHIEYQNKPIILEMSGDCDLKIVLSPYGFRKVFALQCFDNFTLFIFMNIFIVNHCLHEG